MTNQPEVSNLLTSAEAAREIGIDRGTLSRWVALGRIKPAMKLPGKTGTALFDPAEVARVRAEYKADRAIAT
jgi:predicted site-specific integrase-resolvase